MLVLFTAGYAQRTLCACQQSVQLCCNTNFSFGPHAHHHQVTVHAKGARCSIPCTLLHLAFYNATSDTLLQLRENTAPCILQRHIRHTVATA
jgi:hypothetical protein